MQRLAGFQSTEQVTDGVCIPSNQRLDQCHAAEQVISQCEFTCLVKVPHNDCNIIKMHDPNLGNYFEEVVIIKYLFRPIF